MTGRFTVGCRVSGGVTGTREATLKRLGEIQYFETRDAAEAEARRLNREMNHMRSTAFFQYWVQEES
jgi:hypothetical protein